MRRAPHRAVVVALVLVVCVACGRKAPPLPPLIRVADPTRDLSVVQHEWLAELRWSYPQTTTAGGPLPDLEKVEVLRADIPKGQEPPAGTDRDREARRKLFEAQASVIGVLEGESMALASDGAMLVFSEDFSGWTEPTDEGGGVVIWYAVRSECCNRRMSELSNVVRLEPAEPPAAPSGLEITPEQDGLHLSWLEDPDFKVRVERSEGEGVFKTVTPSPPTENSWVDREAAQGRTWSYRLRAVEATAAGAITRIGEAGPPVTVDYPDRYPPGPPSELVCLPEGRKVRLRWRGSADVARYVVERSLDDGTTLMLADDIKSPHYLDQNASPAGATYQVRAVDDAGNLSEAVLCRAAPGVGP